MAGEVLFCVRDVFFASRIFKWYHYCSRNWSGCGRPKSGGKARIVLTHYHCPGWGSITQSVITKWTPTTMLSASCTLCFKHKIFNKIHSPKTQTKLDSPGCVSSSTNVLDFKYLRAKCKHGITIFKSLFVVEAFSWVILNHNLVI